jgi:hypothetical protein
MKNKILFYIVWNLSNIGGLIMIVALAVNYGWVGGLLGGALLLLGVISGICAVFNDSVETRAAEYADPLNEEEINELENQVFGSKSNYRNN